MNKLSLTNHKGPKGFTLIEILVVVLIIGILAAVALPQYQKSVTKTKTVQAMVLAKAVGDALQVYYATHGKYTNNWSDLDIEVEGVVGNFYTQGDLKTNEGRYHIILRDGQVIASANIPDTRNPRIVRQVAPNPTFFCPSGGCSICYAYSANPADKKYAQSICETIGDYKGAAPTSNREEIYFFK